MERAEAESSSRQKLGGKVTILMADDHPIFRKAVRDILEKEPDFSVRAEANNGEEAVNLATQLGPDIVIMDISMPGMNGLEATREIKAKHPSIGILVLTVHNDIEHILSILEAGAAGYLTKSASAAEVVAAVRSVVAGDTIIATAVFQQVLKHTMRYPTKPVVIEGKNKLTTRELQVLKLAGKGLSNKDISLKLDLSFRTVKAYMVEIFSKLGVSSRTEAVITGLRAGLINKEDLE
jgi:DNA-binding NarL/FixJ family response regulator